MILFTVAADWTSEKIRSRQNDLSVQMSLIFSSDQRLFLPVIIHLHSYYLSIYSASYYFSMDIDKLISLVFENRCLWDLKDKNYHNRDVARRNWEKVAAELNTSCK